MDDFLNTLYNEYIVPYIENDATLKYASELYRELPQPHADRCEHLRACLISSDEDGNEGESKNLSRNNEFTLTIFPKPAEFVQPAEKALYHPTTRQHNKSV